MDGETIKSGRENAGKFSDKSCGLFVGYWAILGIKLGKQLRRRSIAGLVVSIWLMGITFLDKAERIALELQVKIIIAEPVVGESHVVCIEST